MKTTIISPHHESFSPAAGWLSKMVSLPFGRSRWISRFFVLLDSELRFYKDEHSESSSQVLNLRQIAQVIPASTVQHPYCFRLEPKQQQQTAHGLRPWIIECKSEVDMEMWVSAIKNRINKYSPASSPLLRPTSQTHRVTSVASVNSIIMASPEVYRMPALPLRCTNMSWGEDESRKRSLLARRNKKLAPIVTQSTSSSSSMTCSPQPPLPLHSGSLSAMSSSSTLPSPTGAVLGCSLLISPGIIDRYSNYSNKENNGKNQTVLRVDHQKKDKQCDAMSLESSSPTYLMYKKRFHL
ncbi:pre-60S ribosomal particles component [Mucor velutinosus]|uniref:Pre-60S ribosomal particles component n=1 Tax=Mucor velutinosus TaxID=708070 RepID=A0AAN7DM77_9FUNG|nr:pre-60S ribosomal particles component [Mucor velutinosus]